MTVVFANRQRARKINLRLLKQIVKALLADLEIAKAELEINLVATPGITRLNEKFLHHKGPTDVIAFDYTENVAQASRLHQSACSRDGHATLHGEIFICMDEAVLQAQKFGVSWQSEVVRYVVHGVLHLLGHDDLCAGARRKMKREENRLLRKLSLRFALSEL
jgi:probable rRNA maturation factor